MKNIWTFVKCVFRKFNYSLGSVSQKVKKFLWIPLNGGRDIQKSARFHKLCLMYRFEHRSGSGSLGFYPVNLFIFKFQADEKFFF